MEYFGIFCPRCGAPNQANDRVCASCGERLRVELPSPNFYPVPPAASGVSTGQSHAPQPRKRLTTRHKVVFGLAAGLAVTCIACGGTALAIEGMEAFAASLRNLMEIPSPTPPTSTPYSTLSTSLVTYHGHTNDVTSVSWSPDGTRIVSASDDETAQVWQAE